jgi:Diacylglycerol acyltransferase
VAYEGGDETRRRVVEALTDTEKSAIFAGHPHGLLAISSLLLLFSKDAPLVADSDVRDQASVDWRRVRPCIHRHVFRVPLLRDVALWIGAIDVSRTNIVSMLHGGTSIYLAPGGCREMILDRSLPIQRQHQGFLRIAFEEKRIVFPVVHMGQERVFLTYTCHWLDRLRGALLGATGYPFPTLFLGPFPSPLTSHVLPPFDPSTFDGIESFIEAYYKCVIGFYAEKTAQ